MSFVKGFLVLIGLLFLGLSLYNSDGVNATANDVWGWGFILTGITL